MFNKAWIQLAVILIPVALLFDVRALLVVSAFLLTVVPVAWWWSRRSLDGVAYERSLGERRAFPGETVDLTLRLTKVHGSASGGRIAVPFCHGPDGDVP